MTESPPQSQGFDINHVISEAKRVLTSPVAFYQTMPKTGGFANPVIFVAVMAFASGVIAAILSLLGVGQLGGMAMGLSSIILMPIFAVIGSFIGAAILFVIWKLMGSPESYETAYRCLAFGTAIYPIITILSIIPYVASIIGVAWFSYLMIEASTHVHGRDRQKATIVFGILAVLLIISNISSERMARNMDARLNQLSQDIEGWQNLPPDEAGRRMGEFLKSMEEAMQSNDP